MSIITGTYSVCSLGCRTAEDCDNSCVGRKRKPTAPAPADMRKPEDGGTDERDLLERALTILGCARARLSDDSDFLWSYSEVEQARSLIAATLGSQRATIAERDRRIADLEAGLEPFASVLTDVDAERIKTWTAVTSKTPWPESVPVEALLRARALLSGQQDTEGE